MSLDRLDNDADYSKSNCKWSNRSDQMLNRRTFKNNTSGVTGVIKIGDRFEARFHADGVRYRLGTYPTAREAAEVRKAFIVEFSANPDRAIAKLQVPTVWATSGTKIRGISKHKDGGYIVRATRNGERVYVGYFRTLNEACDAKSEFDKS